MNGQTEKENSQTSKTKSSDKIEIKCEYTKLVPISQLKPHPKNPNKHSQAQIERLCELIKYQGIRVPCIVSSLSGLVLAGHGRLRAYKKLGVNEVPVVYQEFKDTDQENAFLVSDNGIAEWSDLDFSLVDDIMGDLGPDFDMDWLGLKKFDLDVGDTPTEKKEKSKEYIISVICMDHDHQSETFDKLTSDGYIIKTN